MADSRPRSPLRAIRWRTFSICLGLAALLWMLRTLENEREITYVFEIELVGAEASTGLNAQLIDSVARARAVVSPWEHLMGRLSPDREPVRLQVEGLRTPRTEVPSARLMPEIERRIGKTARVKEIVPATLAIDVQRRR